MQAVGHPGASWGGANLGLCSCRKLHCQCEKGGKSVGDGFGFWAFGLLGFWAFGLFVGASLLANSGYRRRRCWGIRTPSPQPSP
ncbi:hypothetical protein PCLA_01r0309 [Pseudomonas citronellolis]|nr:hypothetical protein PCLA_01r0309 [Pseudomonas citronellolis]